MAKDKNQPPPSSPPADSPAPVEEPGEKGGALFERPPEAIDRLESELGEARSALAQSTDKYLRLAAEFENFKKRSVRERAELRLRAQAELVEKLVDAIDDLGRFAHIDPAQTDVKTIHEAMEMVERKVWKQLDGVGVTRIDQTGVPFDPRVHEAVTTQPATDPAQDHTVGAVLQSGYKLGDTLIRPARVVVLTWQGGESPAQPAPSLSQPTADG